MEKALMSILLLLNANFTYIYSRLLSFYFSIFILPAAHIIPYCFMILYGPVNLAVMPVCYTISIKYIQTWTILHENRISIFNITRGSRKKVIFFSGLRPYHPSPSSLYQKIYSLWVCRSFRVVSPPFRKKHDPDSSISKIRNRSPTWYMI